MQPDSGSGCTLHREVVIMSKMPHIRLDETINATAAILPGDPARVDVVASFLEDVKEEGFNREYKSITGTYKGRRILVMSTGMGGASTAIGVEELADLGVKDIIRIGSAGALQKDLQLGQLIICRKAVCDDGASLSYLGRMRYADPMLEQTVEKREKDDICFAYADETLTRACLAAAQAKGFDALIGSTRSHDALYLKTKPELDRHYSMRGISGSDMETAAVLAVGGIRGVRTCSILNVVVEWEADIKEGVGAYKDGAAAAAAGERNEIITALEALAAVS